MAVRAGVASWLRWLEWVRSCVLRGMRGPVEVGLGWDGGGRTASGTGSPKRSRELGDADADDGDGDGGDVELGVPGRRHPPGPTALRVAPRSVGRRPRST